MCLVLYSDSFVLLYRVRWDEEVLALPGRGRERYRHRHPGQHQATGHIPPPLPLQPRTPPPEDRQSPVRLPSATGLPGVRGVTVGGGDGEANVLQTPQV